MYFEALRLVNLNHKFSAINEYTSRNLPSIVTRANVRLNTFHASSLKISKQGLLSAVSLSHCVHLILISSRFQIPTCAVVGLDEDHSIPLKILDPIYVSLVIPLKL